MTETAKSISIEGKTTGGKPRTMARMRSLMLNTEKEEIYRLKTFNRIKDLYTEDPETIVTMDDYDWVKNLKTGYWEVIEWSKDPNGEDIYWKARLDFLKREIKLISCKGLNSTAYSRYNGFINWLRKNVII